MNNEWYHKLNKPSWSPADYVFGQVWSVLYVIIFIVNIYISVLIIEGDLNWLVGIPFWLNLFFNIIYTPIQFGLKNNLLALADILLVLATIFWSMLVMWPINNFIALSYSPYLLWVSIATVLQVSITWLNRKK